MACWSGPAAAARAADEEMEGAGGGDSQEGMPHGNARRYERYMIPRCRRGSHLHLRCPGARSTSPAGTDVLQGLLLPPRPGSLRRGRWVMQLVEAGLQVPLSSTHSPPTTLTPPQHPPPPPPPPPPLPLLRSTTQSTTATTYATFITTTHQPHTTTTHSNGHYPPPSPPPHPPPPPPRQYHRRRTTTTHLHHQPPSPTPFPIPPPPLSHTHHHQQKHHLLLNRRHHHLYPSSPYTSAGMQFRQAKPQW